MKKTISFSLFLLSLIFLQASDIPTKVLGNAAFTTSASQVCPGDSVTFTATSTTQLAYLWKVNGVPFSQNQISGLRLTRDTTYTITLIAADLTGLDSVTQIVEAVTPPLLSFSNYVEENCTGSQDGELAVTVTNGTGPFSILWSTGDTTASIDQLTGGMYTVHVVDPVGCEARDTVQLFTFPGIQAAITGNTAIQGRACKGDSVFFTNSSAIINANTSFTWFQDGAQVSQMTDYGFTFADTGTYQLMLAGEINICRDTAYLTMRVTDPVAGFRSTAGDQVCPDEVVQFTNTSVGATDYFWYTDTVLFSQQANPGYAFNVNGVQPIRLIATDGACADTLDWVVNVLAPTASFMADTLGPLCAGQSVNFTNSSTGAIAFDWLSNGVSFSQNANASYSFMIDGSFRVDMIASDSVCTDTASVIIDVNGLPGIGGQVTGESCEGTMDGEIDLTLQGNGPFASNWTHGPTTPFIAGLGMGTYTVEVEDMNGCVNRDTFEIQVLGGITADFTSALNTPGTYQFTDQSTAGAVSWLWEFGDGNVSPMQNPTHTYTSSGAYDVCLIVTDQYGCDDTTCATLSVSVGIDKDKIRQLNVYPNPTDGMVVLQSNAFIGQTLKVRAFDQLGREVFVEERVGQEKIQINLSHLSHGVYTLLLEGKGDFWVGKVMKK